MTDRYIDLSQRVIPEGLMEEPPLTETDALVIVLHATNAYATLMDDDMPSEHQQGMTLMYEALLTKSKPLLPDLPEMSHIMNMIENVQALARKIRERLGLPQKM